MQNKVDESNALLIKERENAKKAIEEAPPVVKEIQVIVEDTQKIESLTLEVESLKVRKFGFTTFNLCWATPISIMLLFLHKMLLKVKYCREYVLQRIQLVTFFEWLMNSYASFTTFHWLIGTKFHNIVESLASIPKYHTNSIKLKV